MNSYRCLPPPSARPSINDLGGYILCDYSFPMHHYCIPAEQVDFGLNPLVMPSQKPHQMCTAAGLNDWPDLDRDEEKGVDKQGNGSSYDVDNLVLRTLPNATSATSRYDHITPPRTISAVSSDDLGKEQSISPVSAVSESQRESQSSQKLQAPASNGPACKRRKNRVKAVANVEDIEAPEDSKRKASLEKNRLAAYKCRRNKKKKIEQLQADSHEKAVRNAFLKNQIMRMEEEIQQTNAMLLSHAGYESCRLPEDVQIYLSLLATNTCPSRRCLKLEGRGAGQTDDRW